MVRTGRPARTPTIIEYHDDDEDNDDGEDDDDGEEGDDGDDFAHDVIDGVIMSLSIMMICRYNRFECQVSPDIHNKHQMIRAAATLDVQG